MPLLFFKWIKYLFITVIGWWKAMFPCALSWLSLPYMTAALLITHHHSDWRIACHCHWSPLSLTKTKKHPSMLFFEMLGTVVKAMSNHRLINTVCETHAYIFFSYPSTENNNRYYLFFKLFLNSSSLECCESLRCDYSIPTNPHRGTRKKCNIISFKRFCRHTVHIEVSRGCSEALYLQGAHYKEWMHWQQQPCLFFWHPIQI